MKNLTREQVLNMSLKELGFDVSQRQGKPYLQYEKDNTPTIKLSGIGIQIIEPKPEITVKNLGEFMAKFGEYPLSTIGPDEYNDYYDAMPLTQFIPTSNKRGQYYSEELQDYYDECEITDSRWTHDNLKSDGGR